MNGWTACKLLSFINHNREQSCIKDFIIESDIYNLIAENLKIENLDILLKQIQSDDNSIVLKYEKVDEEINYVFFYYKNHLGRLKFYSEIMGIDTTHKTNMYKLYLVLLSCVDNFGKTGILTIGLLKTQNIQSFEKFLTDSQNAIGKIIIFYKIRDNF